jgi:hypothetical protein
MADSRAKFFSNICSSQYVTRVLIDGENPQHPVSIYKKFGFLPSIPVTLGQVYCFTYGNSEGHGVAPRGFLLLYSRRTFSWRFLHDGTGARTSFFEEFIPLQYTIK